MGRHTAANGQGLDPDSTMAAPPLKTDPKYGYFPWWPENGDDWVHPEDVAAARAMIPSGRIYRRDGTSGPYVVLHYGEVRLRVRRTLWCEVEPGGFEIGDWVEVASRGLSNEPRTGTIREMLWDDGARAIRYQVLENDCPVESLYAAADLRHVEPTPPLDRAAK
jgi:hypothetical protein